MKKLYVLYSITLYISIFSMEKDNDNLTEPEIFNLSPLHVAIQEKNRIAINSLIETMSDLNACDFHHYTPLHTAILAQDGETVIKLLKKGVCLSIQSKKNDTPLDTAIKMYVIFENNENIIKLLLKYNSPINYQNTNTMKVIKSILSPPIYQSAMMGNVNELKLLPHNTFDITDTDGTTPLMWTCSRGHIEYTIELLKHNVNISARDRYNNTPYTIAKNNNHRNITILLENYTKILLLKYLSHTNIFNQQIQHLVPLIVNYILI